MEGWLLSAQRKEGAPCLDSQFHSVSGQKSPVLFYNPAYSSQILGLLYLNGGCMPFAPCPDGGLCKPQPPGPVLLHLPPLSPCPSTTLYAFLSSFLLPPTLKPAFRKFRLKRALVLLSFPSCIAAYVNKAMEICIGWHSQKPGKPSTRNFIGYAFTLDAFSVWLSLNWGRLQSGS